MPITNEQDMRLDPRVAREDAWRISPPSNGSFLSHGSSHTAPGTSTGERSGQLVPSKALSKCPAFFPPPPFPPFPFPNLSMRHHPNFLAETSQKAFV